MNTLRWITGAALIAGYIVVAFVFPLPLDLGPAPISQAFVSGVFYILLLSGFFCLYRVLSGPTAADRLVAIDILGVLIVGCCAVLAIGIRSSWYIDIGIAWALMSFIGALALAKYLEGRPLDE